MQQHLPSRAAPWIVGAAAVLFVAAIGYSVSRDSGTRASTSAILKAEPASDQPATVVALQARVRLSPEDADAWGALGNGLFGENRFPEAAAAFERGATLAPTRADLWSALGEARVMASARDPMPAPALAAFRKAVSLDPRDPRSRYFLAVARDLQGDHKGAIDDWFALLADTPPGAPWENDLRRTIAQVAKINTINVAARLAANAPTPMHPQAFGVPNPTSAIPGPTSEQMRAASALPPHEQTAMVQGMVAKLEGRLKENPSNIEGWVMLMRSRVTLGEQAKASAALDEAIAANPGARTQLQNAAQALGVTAR